jgi:NitT/TauT family transport system ATP-binding protein
MKNGRFRTLSVVGEGERSAPASSDQSQTDDSGLGTMTIGGIDPDDANEHKSVLSIRSLGKSYGETAAIANVTFDLRKGEFASLVGPSGCGKTTLLKVIAGLIPASAGEIRVGDTKVNGPADGMVMLFQDYSRSLLPWRSVRRNVELPLEALKLARQERAELADSYLDLVGLHGFGDRYPFQLSGGMQQRAAIARALVGKPRILLMDEPFASVDAQTRLELQDITMDLMSQSNTTVLFVTHDIEEAIYMSSRVLILGGLPSNIADDIRIELPIPRNQLHTKADSRFLGYREHIYPQIRSTARRSDSRGLR